MAEKNPIVTLEVADYEPIKIELHHVSQLWVL